MQVIQGIDKELDAFEAIDPQIIKTSKLMIFNKGKI